MILGTHNSATGGKLLWWLRPLSWVINPTSKCQDKSIDEQLNDGVKLFNLQVAYDGKRWRFSHGLAVYEEDVILTIAKMKACATAKEPIYFQLYLDRSFWFAQDEDEFEKLVEAMRIGYCNNNFVMQRAWVEGTNKYLHESDAKIDIQEKYWTVTWAKNVAKRWYDKLPLPKWHAKRFNVLYRCSCCAEYLMLDFYEM